MNPDIDQLQLDLQCYHVNTNMFTEKSKKEIRKELKSFLDSRTYRKGLECSCERHQKLAREYDDTLWKDLEEKRCFLIKGLFEILSEDMKAI
jgi:hypothetical protein